MEISVDVIKELRAITSCGVIDCKNALEKAKGDIEQAKKILQKRGLELAAKKGSRAAKEGRIDTYIHMGNKLAVIVEVNCETDFVARSEDFCQFVKDVAMHIAGVTPTPRYISGNDIPADILEAQADKETFKKENCLLSQPFVKDTSKTIQDYLNSIIARMGENIFIGRFTRYKVNEVE